MELRPSPDEWSSVTPRILGPPEISPDSAHPLNATDVLWCDLRERGGAFPLTPSARNMYAARHGTSQLLARAIHDSHVRLRRFMSNKSVLPRPDICISQQTNRQLTDN